MRIVITNEMIKDIGVITYTWMIAALSTFQTQIDDWLLTVSLGLGVVLLLVRIMKVWREIRK